ncbi:hypothetical protein [Andreprevotia chitinilytica]|uniref:hypothetical protein n=1 Tax=Andreprevotia chitinilytica TaxID=396808 RepID=UPI00055672FF|nr:hypothetical protein [Andreprevotia chitinilytica]
METRTLRLSRDQSWADWLRAYQIVFNGEIVGTIRHGETQDVVLPAGAGSLRMKIDWASSNTIELPDEANGSVVACRCGSSLQGWRLLLSVWYITFGYRNYLWLRQIDVLES